MQTPLLNERDLEFILYEVLNTESLLQRERYNEHSREIFDATLNTAKQIATKYFANHNQKGDEQEPTFDGQSVSMIPETQQAWDAFAEAGFLAAHYDFEQGGMQMPEVIVRTAMAYFNAANVASSGYPFLTMGAANLINTFASEEHKARFLPPMQDGRFAGTMALTEPNQGSALADISTYAVEAEDGTYRLFGQKMYISGGDQSLTDNIVHMVLARIKGAPAGVKGISLFICPKFNVNEDGTLGERNDVALAGLLHKMGYRNTTSTVLSFGEKGGAKAFLVGEPHKGLQYMFQMMNEARIGVALGASTLGYQGYNYSLEYARQRPQGRLPSSKDPETKQVSLVEHADVRRMLLMQKSYVEGALCLCLYASQLFEDSHTAPSEAERKQAFQLLDLLTPVVKSWPSKYCPKANDLAIQVLGGSGYIREYPVEQYYRDNRLNPIHEGTEGIQALDLLARKVPMNNLANVELLKGEIQLTIEQCQSSPRLQALAEKLAEGLGQLEKTTMMLLGGMQKDVDRGLANASLYLDVFGRVVMSWIWLQQAIKANIGLESESISPEDTAFYQGKLQSAQYYIEWELPEITHQCAILECNNQTCFDMQDEWF